VWRGIDVLPGSAGILWGMGRVVKRAFMFRFYPTDMQAAELARTFGCVRKVYNLALAARSEAWTVRQERVTYNATSAMLTEWKKTQDLAFLNDVSCVPLQQALRHLQTAFTNFFAKRAGYPRFKSRKYSRRSAEYTTSAFRYRDGQLTLAKMDRPLDIVWSRLLPEGAAPSTVTVRQDAAGRWFVSLLCEDTIQDIPATNAAVGVDAGLNSLLTLSTGEKVANLRHERRDRDRLALAQRRLARKAKGDGANRAKARITVARIHARIADRRRDHLHKVTTRLVRDNQTIVIEALAETMPLNVRTWTCRCGTIHDRDVNAARNLLAEGLSVIACGGGVRPQRESSRTGQSSAKQETRRATAGLPSVQGGEDVKCHFPVLESRGPLVGTF
jgi:putative transposase